MSTVSRASSEMVGSGESRFQTVSNGSEGKEMEAVPYPKIGTVSRFQSAIAHDSTPRAVV